MRISLDYEEMIPVNGDRQSIRIRSADAEHPVMLFLHGGPGVCNRHLVLRHNGSLALAPHEGPGTTVRLVLPIAGPPAS